MIVHGNVHVKSSPDIIHIDGSRTNKQDHNHENKYAPTAQTWYQAERTRGEKHRSIAYIKTRPPVKHIVGFFCDSGFWWRSEKQRKKRKESWMDEGIKRGMGGENESAKRQKDQTSKKPRSQALTASP